MICTNCHKTIDVTSKFCGSCGTKINQISSQDTLIPNPAPAKNGLGGWLILVIIGLFISALFVSLPKIFSSLDALGSDTFSAFSDTTSAYYTPGFAEALLFEIISTIVLFCATIYLIILFFKKSKKFPKYYINILLANIAFLVISLCIWSSLVMPGEAQKVLNDTLSDQYKAITQSILSLLVWGSYMKKSMRVKHTFVN